MTPLYIKKNGKVVKTIMIPGVLVPILGLIFLAIFLTLFVLLSGYLTIAFVVLCCGGVVTWAVTRVRDWIRRVRRP